MFPRKKPKKPVAPWRQNILSHHQDRPSSADRGDFPAAVIRELISEAGGVCQVCRAAPDTTTHHVQPRGRRSSPGRGVKTNGLRCCGICHDHIQTHEDELQRWIEIYRQRHGEYFWFDAQDWEEFRQREKLEQVAEDERRKRAELLAPLLGMLKDAANRRLTTVEKRTLSELSDKQITLLVGLLRESMGTPVREFGYGHFDD